MGMPNPASLISVGAEIISLLANLSGVDLDECHFTVKDRDGNEITSLSFRDVADGLTEVSRHLAAGTLILPEQGATND